MNKLLTYNGGQPFTTGDLDFIQQNYTEALEAVGLGFSGNGLARSCILWGITPGDGTDVAPGAVLADGQVFLVPSTIRRTIEKYLCFREVREDGRIFADGKENKVKLVHEPYVASATDGACAYIALDGALTLRQLILGEGAWEKVPDVLFSGETRGTVEYNKVLDAYRLRTPGGIKAVNNQLFEFTDRETDGGYAGIAIEEQTALYSVFLSGRSCFYKKADGSLPEDDKTLRFNDVVMTRVPFATL